MGVKSTFRERGERKAMQRGDEGKNREVSRGWAGLSPAGSEQASAAASGRSAVSRSALVDRARV